MNERKDIDEIWETRINELLDGELGPEEASELKQEAGSNAALAQAIIDAYALQTRLDALNTERAPDTLRAKLADIPVMHKKQPQKQPRKQPGRWFGMPRWVPVGAMAAVPLLVIAMVMMQPGQDQSQNPTGQPEFTEAEILKAREDVALAFAYLDRIGHRTGEHIESELADELGSSVTDNVSRYMPYTNNPEQEESS